MAARESSTTTNPAAGGSAMPKDLTKLNDEDLEALAHKLGDEATQLRARRVEVRSELDRRAAEAKARELVEQLDPAVAEALQRVGFDTVPAPRDDG
jgi:hypothetical protein